MDLNAAIHRLVRFVRLYFSAGKRVLQEISGSHLVLTGAAVLLAAGVAYAVQNKVPTDSDKQRRLRVLVTGGTKGFGAALVQEFIALGDDVIVAARNPVKIDTSKHVWDNQNILMMQCDMSKPDQVEELGFQVIEKFGSLDLWINNAGASQAVKAPLWKTPLKTINSIISTNFGSLVYGSRMALRVLQSSELGGAVVNIDGAGSSGMTTPYFATYGYSKAGVPQLAKTLNAELKRAEGDAATTKGRAALQRIAVHTASPGMVATELLTGGLGWSKADLRTRRIFNILAEHPHTVAAWMAPRLRGLVTKNRHYTSPRGDKEEWEVELTGPPLRGAYLKFLTPVGAAGRFISSLFGVRGSVVSETPPAGEDTPPQNAGQAESKKGQ